MRAASWLMTLGLLSGNGQLITFDSSRLGSVPPGWVTCMTHDGTAPKWEILKDKSAPSPPYVLGQVSTDADRARFPLAILQKPYFRDGEVSVRLKPVAGHTDRTGGLVWRYRDDKNYYLVKANALAKNIEVYKVESGKMMPLAPRGLPPGQYSIKHETLRSDAWSILKVAFKGPAWSVYVNHRRIAQGTDPTFARAGRVGLCTQADSITYFDDFRVVPK